MIVKELNKEDVATLMRSSLGLTKGGFDDTLFACCIRRAAGFLCPCSIDTLISTTYKSLQYLFNSSDEDLKNKIEEIVNQLLVIGDLMELSEVSTNDLKIKTTSVFAAHPSYVLRPDGSAMILGIVPDEISPVASLAERIQYQRCKRLLSPKDDEDLPQILNTLGVICVSESAWLKLPKVISAQEYLSVMNDKLSSTMRSEVDGLLILDSAKSNIYYKGRWTDQNALSGRFVAKRPSLYGTYIWCYAELSGGNVTKFIDIPLKLNGITQRGCDGGWHLQMAIDNSLGSPQVYRIRSCSDGKIFDFYCPLPLWAERRFIAIGQTFQRQNNLFSYLMPEAEFEAAESFLKKYLWLIRNNKDTL